MCIEVDGSMCGMGWHGCVPGIDVGYSVQQFIQKESRLALLSYVNRNMLAIAWLRTMYICTITYTMYHQFKGL